LKWNDKRESDTIIHSGRILQACTTGPPVRQP
jgi:hypothetical protein